MHKKACEVNTYIDYRAKTKDIRVVILYDSPHTSEWYVMRHGIGHMAINDTSQQQALGNGDLSEQKSLQDRLRIQGATRLVAAIAISILSWLLPSKEAEREATDCIEIFMHSIEKVRAEGGISGTMCLVYLYVSLPLSALKGAWEHRVKLARLGDRR